MGRVTAEVKVAEEKCNCRDKINCPLNDDCLVEGLVYRKKVEPTKGYKKCIYWFNGRNVGNEI